MDLTADQALNQLLDYITDKEQKTKFVKKTFLVVFLDSLKIFYKDLDGPGRSELYNFTKEEIKNCKKFCSPKTLPAIENYLVKKIQAKLDLIREARIKADKEKLEAAKQIVIDPSMVIDLDGELSFGAKKHFLQ